MIRIGNQICCSFSIGEANDFIETSQLHTFMLHEAAGNRRPILELSFNINDEEIVKYFNAGNILNVSFGINQLEKNVVQFELYEDEINKEFGMGYNVTIRAALYVPRFTSNVKSKSYLNKGSLEVISEIAKEYNFNLVTNITKTNDKMNWYQTGETTWNYLTKVWLHSYINNSTFQVFGFDADNIYFYDMRQLIVEDPKWIFSTKKASDNASNIVNFGCYQNENMSGTLSQLIGKNLINKTYNTDTGTITDDSYSLKNFTGVDTNKININSKGCVNYNYNVINNDYHGNYVKAYNQNLRNNIMYSSFVTYITTAGQFKQLKLLDTVTFDISPKDNRMDGISVITGITYQYSDKKMLINLTLNKEAPSGMRGVYLESGA